MPGTGRPEGSGSVFEEWGIRSLHGGGSLADRTVLTLCLVTEVEMHFLWALGRARGGNCHRTGRNCLPGSGIIESVVWAVSPDSSARGSHGAISKVETRVSLSAALICKPHSTISWNIQEFVTVSPAARVIFTQGMKRNSWASVRFLFIC